MQEVSISPSRAETKSQTRRKRGKNRRRNHTAARGGASDAQGRALRGPGRGKTARRAFRLSPTGGRIARLWKRGGRPLRGDGICRGTHCASATGRVSVDMCWKWGTDVRMRRIHPTGEYERRGRAMRAPTEGSEGTWVMRPAKDRAHRVRDANLHDPRTAKGRGRTCIRSKTKCAPVPKQVRNKTATLDKRKRSTSP